MLFYSNPLMHEENIFFSRAKKYLCFVIFAIIDCWLSPLWSIYTTFRKVFCSQRNGPVWHQAQWKNSSNYWRKLWRRIYGSIGYAEKRRKSYHGVPKYGENGRSQKKSETSCDHLRQMYLLTSVYFSWSTQRFNHLQVIFCENFL